MNAYDSDAAPLVLQDLDDPDEDEDDDEEEDEDDDEEDEDDEESDEDDVETWQVSDSIPTAKGRAMLDFGRRTA